jgi:hypothetical protein
MHVKQLNSIAALLICFTGLGQSLLWQKKTALDNELDEISGLILADSIAYTINDSGGKACLYGFSLSTGQIQSRHFLKGVKNKDFEALTQSSDHIYIGDIGNNFANRSSFQIYVLNKKDIPIESNPTYKTLHFTLPKYAAGWQKKHNFDMEAMVINPAEDSLYIFSKNRANDLVNVYSLAINTDDSLQTARLKGQFHLQGMITAAAVHGTDLFLLNYNLWSTTLYKIPNYYTTPIGKWLPIPIKVKGKGYQREALWIENGVIYIGTERTRAKEQALDEFVFK